MQLSIQWTQICWAPAMCQLDAAEAEARQSLDGGRRKTYTWEVILRHREGSDGGARKDVGAGSSEWLKEGFLLRDRCGETETQQVHWATTKKSGWQRRKSQSGNGRQRGWQERLIPQPFPAYSLRPLTFTPKTMGNRWFEHMFSFKIDHSVWLTDWRRRPEARVPSDYYSHWTYDWWGARGSSSGEGGEVNSRWPTLRGLVIAGVDSEGGEESKVTPEYVVWGIWVDGWGHQLTCV